MRNPKAVMPHAAKYFTVPTVLLIVVAFEYLAAASEILPDPLAVLSGCSQSSTADGSDCSKALSNFYSPSVGFADPGVCAQTGATSGYATHWWQAQVNPTGPVRVTFVRVVQQQDCCNYAGYLNLEVTLDGNDCEFNGYIGAPQTPSNQLFFCNRTGQTLQVRSGATTQLTLCVVQVFTERLTSVQLDHPQLSLGNCSRNLLPIALCELALDGNINQNFEQADLVCIYLSPNTWWQAQAPSSTLIKYIRIYNEMYCCLDSTFSLTITVDGSQCASYSGTYFTAGDFLCNKTGRTIQITAGDNSLVMPLCEVQVFGEPPDKSVDLGKQLSLTRCCQSSVVYGGSCGKAMDNSTNQTCSLCSRTQIEHGWWQAKTDRLALVSFVRIYLSTDCCFEEQSNITVTVDGRECSPYDTDSNPFVQTFFCNETGGAVRVSNLGMSSLALCEVQVFGDYKASAQLSDPKPLALAVCSQSSIAPGGCGCEKAIDGDANQNPTKNNSCCAVTRGRKTGSSWWQARTAAGDSFIKSVVVYSQLGGPSLSRLLSVTVDGHRCLRHQADVDFSVVAFKCGLRGRLIRVSSGGGRSLALCEVVAFGWPVTKKFFVVGGRHHNRSIGKSARRKAFRP